MAPKKAPKFSTTTPAKRNPILLVTGAMTAVDSKTGIPMKVLETMHEIEMAVIALDPFDARE